MSFRRVAWVGVCAGLVAATGCRAVSSHARHQVRIAAAADLNVALGVLVDRFRASHDVDVKISYGSSGTFYAQLLSHAPFDMFFSADLDYPRQLAARGLTLENGEFSYAVGRLVVWTPSTSRLDVEHRGLQALIDPSVAHVAIANPEHAPYGRAAVAALRAANLYEQVQPKLVYGENVAQALQFAGSGAADAGIVALSLALTPSLKDRARWFEVPLTMYPRMEQGGTILKWAGDADEARALRAFVLSADGRDIFKQYGFFLPDR
ncbi:MAG: molybdate ABC transporter substrate-binding protein [Acidobacteria bacterium]|nr:molybdate ABC transporter substrate-binding protein [Acidobacteriota bacterium]